MLRTRTLERSGLNRLSCLLLALLAWPCIAEATLVLLVQTPAGFVLAADSVRIQMRENGDYKRTRTCKIYDSTDHAFAALGTIFESWSGFDVPKIVKTTLDVPSTPSAAAAAVSEAVKMQASRALEWLAKNKPSTAARYHDTFGRVQVLLVSKRLGHPQAWVITVDTARSIDAARVQVEQVSTGFATFGVDDAIGKRYRESGTATFPGSGLDVPTNLERIRKLVEAESAGEPSVGLPVDAVFITDKEVKWLTPRSDCQAALAALERSRESERLPDSKSKPRN